MVVSVKVVNAASFTISVGTKNLTKGGTTKLTIKGSDLAGRFNITSSNSGVISVSEDRAWIDNNSYSITLTALSVGSSTIKVTPSDVSGYNSSASGLSAKTIVVNVSLPREKSNDNTLSKLSVEGYEISPEFNKDTLDYKVSVPEGTTKVKINATANSRYATLTGNGEVDVKEGINNFSVVVTSETGNKKVYNVNIEVIDQNPINVKVDYTNYTIVKLRDNFKCPDNYTESEVVIDNQTVPTCVNENIKYTLVALKDEQGNITNFVYDSTNKSYKQYSFVASSKLSIVINNEKELSSFEKTKIKIDDKEYDGYKYPSSKRFFIVYGINIETGEEDYYLYDSKNNTFSIMEMNYLNELVKQNKLYLYISIAFGVALFLALICIIALNSNKKKIIKSLKEDNEEPKEKKKKEKKEDKKEYQEEIDEDEKIDNNEIIEEQEDDNEIYNLLEDDDKPKKKKKKKNKK
jgi:hypothetical protein